MQSEHNYTDEIKKNQKEIKNGQIITMVEENSSNPKTKAYITGLAFFDTNPRQILEIVKDLENYHLFMPNIEKVEIYKVSKIGIEANYFTALPFGIKKKYRLIHKVSTVKDVITFNWEKVDWPEINKEETLNDVDGRWILIKDAESSGTFVVYSAYLDAGHVPWGLGWLVNSFTKKTVESIIANTKERCKTNLKGNF
tara:strand:+ start:278 stop:868 length:591 start_codon:yes stop_codon:yes gene_type:complete